MILLTEKTPPGRVIAVFGAGLIGAAAVQALRRSATLEAQVMPCAWLDPGRQATDLARVHDRILGLLTSAGPTRSDAATGPRMHFLWCAGKAGFAATESEAAVELASFQNVLDLAIRLVRPRHGPRVAMTLVSSAGGLFEGQQAVDAHSRPSARRPYGALKLAQECHLRACTAPLIKQIYRPTSVYGYARGTQRRGLIPMLIANALQQRVTRIVGRPSTLRDFVWMDDVAMFLARRILADPHADETAVIGSGKPSSIFEIQQTIERMLDRKLYLSYAHDPSNSENITFSKSALPSDWQPSDLTTTVWHIYSDALQGGIHSQQHGN